MADKTVAELLVSELANNGVKRIYGLVGDSLNPISDVLRRDGRIDFIHMRHEESAAFAASAEAQLTEKLTLLAELHRIAETYGRTDRAARILTLFDWIFGPSDGTEAAAS